MKRLYVLRHAKSSWDDAGLSDFERPLNKRGLETAPFMGRTMLEKDYIPDIVVASPAARAASTAKLAAKAASFSRSLSFDERIYEASPQTLMEVMSELEPKAASAMIVDRSPQSGCANPTCATIPRPKNVLMRPFVRSKN